MESLSDTRSLLAKAEVILCDIDGCLLSGSLVLPGARALVSGFGHKLRLLSNNSTDTRATLAARFDALGLSIAPEQCFLAGEVAVRTLAERYPGARVLALATAEIRALCQSLGLLPTDAEPDVALLCRDTGLTFDTLQNLVTHVSRGVPLVLANRDISHPGIAGPAIETGAVYTLLRAVVEPTLALEVGKPMPQLFHAALQGITPANAVMIGDNPDTDLAGARRLGMPCLLIGGSNKAICADIGGLLDPDGALGG